MTVGSTKIKVVTPKSNDFASNVYDHNDVDAKLADDIPTLDSEGVNAVPRSSHRHTRPNTFAEGHNQFIELRCLGRSTETIKELLKDVQKHACASATKTTEIFWPSGATEHNTWLRQSMRPSRPMDTISLDETQKSMIVNDMKAYLHPDTARWYGFRGIPYRRGYLCHGPPGTGKTSLTIALAGLFDLSIYCVPLSSCDLTESDITMLFRDLPPRCVVLINDLDNASLRGEARPRSFVSSSCEHDETSSGVGKSSACAGRSRISLASVLNTIDGAASQEVCLQAP
jgi:chaperone BCS1